MTVDDTPQVAGGRLRRGCVLAVSSALGLGYLPVAPGTWGTLAALPIWWACSGWSVGAFCVGVTIACCAAIAISSQAEAIYGEHDVGRIVIDEVVGLLCTVIGVPWHLPQILAAFVLFRILDAAKPPPISWFDRHVPGGTGVVLDDVVAGLLGCCMLHGARMLNGGIWW